MQLKKLHVVKLFGLPALIILWGVAAPANAQTAPARASTPAQDQDNDAQPRQDYDATRPELAQFDRFLDSHREIGEQVRKDPSVVNREQFVKDHPELQTYLREHPDVREQLRRDPNAFMRQGRFDRPADPKGYGKDNDTTRAELAQFDRFLDGHPDIAQEVRKDPSAVNNYAYVHNHPALLSYLNDHPALAEEVKEDPYNFMSQEKQFEQRDGQPGNGRDNDANRARLAQFDQFLDSHREIDEQLRKNPSLANNQAFVENHPPLMAYLQQHPEVRQQLRSNPAAFMQQENQFDRRDDARTRGDRNREEIARFDQFLDGHREIAEQVRKNPALLNDNRFDKDHPVLQAYLQDHPGIRDEARANPNAFMHQEGQFDRNDRNGYGGSPDMAHDRSADFRQFLNGHPDVAQQLSHNPSLANDKDYMRNHQELQDYLKTHPDVNDELMKNPDSFVKQAQPSPQPQQFDKNGQGMKTPSYDPKATH